MIINLTYVKNVEYTSKSGNKVKGAEFHGVIQDPEPNDHAIGNPCFIQYVANVNWEDYPTNELYSVNFEVTIFNGKPQARVTGLTMFEG